MLRWFGSGGVGGWVDYWFEGKENMAEKRFRGGIKG